MPDKPTEDLSVLLRRCANGDADAERDVFDVAYAHLKVLARAAFNRERRHVTLQASVLVNEAFLRMPRAGEIDWQNRQHFFAVAARAMRRVVIDYARARVAVKRRNEPVDVDLELVAPSLGRDPESILSIDRALTELGTIDQRRATIVEMRFFSGMTHDEIAEVLGVDARTVKRDWAVAKLWLYDRLTRGRASGPPKGATWPSS